MRKLQLTREKILEPIIIISFAVVSLFLWNTPIIYPIKLLVVLLHELSHGIAGFLTGGYIVEIKLSSQLGGQCVLNGGNEVITASAGYLGSLVWGALIFISGYKGRFNAYFSVFLGVMLIYFSVNYVSGIFGNVVAILFAVYLFVSVKYMPKIVHSYVTKFIGLVSCLYVAIDIGQDVVFNHYYASDAYVLEELTGVPSMIWGLIWLIITGSVIYHLFIWAQTKPSQLRGKRVLAG